ncbi:MAG: DNA-3-methyladenine glycosylase family protein [Candidatus Nanopelagicales bacterium]
MRSSQRTWRPARPVSLVLQLKPLRRGTGDPTWATAADGAIWRTTLTPDGSGLERLSINRDGSIELSAWGDGADWLAARLPRLLGSDDDPSGFMAPEALAMVARHFQHWRVGRTDRVLEALVPAVLEQKVTGKEAWRAWRGLVREFGEPAPAAPHAPPGLRTFPTADRWQSIPSWRWHQAGVDSKRAGTLLRAVAVGDQLEGCAQLTSAQSHDRLRSIPGVGLWTAAETAQRALGDADAVSFRDYHVAKEVVYALTGDMNGDDEQMAQLLRPFAGHRYRVQRLVELDPNKRPRRGPRMTINDTRTI